jgi:ATP-grasp domain
MGRAYFIVDPYHEYAQRLISAASEYLGLQAICVHTDPRKRFEARSCFPADERRIAEHAEVPLASLAEFAREAARRHSIAGALPFNEPTLLPSATLAEGAGVPWCPPEALRRFRDKVALVEHLRRARPDLRLYRQWPVTDLRDIRRIGADLPDRFVLKPSRGFGNSGIGFFERDASDEALIRFLSEGGAPWVLAEHVGGREFFANGQVDAKGEISVCAVFQYHRVAANGREALDYLTAKVGRRSRFFARVDAYVREVIAASGLSRSPFHVEIKIDERGPCLIDAGARLVGNRNAFVCEDLHGGTFDPFELACRAYLSPSPAEPPKFDWDAYDASELLYVQGVATSSGRIYSTDGAREVEELPEFAGWVARPELGQRISPTVDLFSCPWSLLLRGLDLARLIGLSGGVRERIDAGARAWAPVRAAVELDGVRRRAQRTLSWLLRGRP